ncbi:MAG: type III polyketide synthase [Ignavibacteriales bacterium]|nr:type III polyketide synthase [Ignavibacteriales bacterium]
MLIDIATASPPYKVLQSKVSEELKKRMTGRPAVARMIDAASAHSGIDSRYFVLPDADDSEDNKFYSSDGNYIRPSTKTRMEEYEKWSIALTEDAVKKLFDSTDFDPDKINRLITISCTGFFAPGLDYNLIEKFQLPRTIKRTNIGFMGCAASLIGFNSVLEAMNNSNEEGNALLVSVELCSLHLQTEATKDNILANLIFADGAAAVLFSNSESMKSKSKLKLLKTNSILFKNSSNYMGWKIGDFGFEMILSSELPKIILEEAVPALIKIFDNWGIKQNDIKHWALHPGGRAILDSLQTGLQLDNEEMMPSRNVLKNYGNMSSASILFVMKEIFNTREIKSNDFICAVAFGPGLSMEVALMKGV